MSEEERKKIISFKPSELRLESCPQPKAQLIGSRCSHCGIVYLGKSRFCVKCSSPEVYETVLTNRGKLVSYTIIHVPPSPLWKGSVPYAIGRVELKEGVEVTSQIVGCDLQNLRVGIEMELVVEKAEQDQEGNDVMVYRWQPI